jgi:hypothetical protein
MTNWVAIHIDALEALVASAERDHPEDREAIRQMLDREVHALRSSGWDPERLKRLEQLLARLQAGNPVLG